MPQEMPKVDLGQLRLPHEARPASARSARGLGWLVLGALLAGAGFLAHRSGVLPWTRLKVEVAPVHLVPRVQGEKHERGPKPLLTADGYVVPRRKANVGAPRSGKIVAIYVEEGDAVVQSQVVARLDESVLKAELARAEANLREARREVQRRENLAREGVSTRLDRDEMLSRVEVCEAELKLAQENLAQCEVVAPFPGVVLAKLAEIGETVNGGMVANANTTGGIVTVADTTTLEVEADVQESRIPDVHPGQYAECTADAFPGLKVPAKVRVLMPQSDRKKATVTVKVTLVSPPAGLRPDMGVKVTFFAPPEAAPAETAESASAATLRIPKRAVQATALGPSVWIVKGGHVARTLVTLGDAAADEVEVTKGLDGSEILVVSDPAGLADGLAVRTE